MKKLALSLSLLAALTFTIISCDNNGDPEPSSKDSDSTAVLPGDSTAVNPGDGDTANPDDSEEESDPTQNTENIPEELLGTWIPQSEKGSICARIFPRAEGSLGTITYKDNLRVDMECNTLVKSVAYYVNEDGSSIFVTGEVLGTWRELKIVELTNSLLHVKEDGEDIKFDKQQSNTNLKALN